MRESERVRERERGERERWIPGERETGGSVCGGGGVWVWVGGCDCT